MRVNFLDEGYREVQVESFRMDHNDRPYVLVTDEDPANCWRAEFRNDEWVVDHA